MLKVHAPPTLRPPETAAQAQRAKPPVRKTAAQAKPPSWPEKVKLLEERNIRTRMLLGMLSDIFRDPAMQGPMCQGHEKLDPSLFELMPLPRDSGKGWKLDLFERVINPAVNALRPGQTLLMCTPEAHSMLLGKDANGENFGISTEDWKQPPRQSGWILRGRRLEEAYDRAKSFPSQARPWMLLEPASTAPPHDAAARPSA
ncbi:hypothetical protein [Roseateles sp. YR242]|uniref:hypothetical protein n=1 Tax=Roseateles sp. YR242 TaxID=1855305 RepID=UPI00116082C8|nr:hypothetical protein [Roseateles sp. YR242]